MVSISVIGQELGARPGLSRRLRVKAVLGGIMKHGYWIFRYGNAVDELTLVGHVVDGCIGKAEQDHP